MTKSQSLLVLLSPPETLKGEVALLHRFFREGLNRYHIRKPGWSKAGVRTYIESIEPRFRERIVLHSWVDLAADFGLRQIHLTEKARRERIAIPSGLTVSTSFHEIDDLLSDDYSYEYVFFGPLFASISKEGYVPHLTCQVVEKAALQSNCSQRVYALGGVSQEKLPLIWSMGFSGIGVIGAVWNATDPLAAFRSLYSACQKMRHTP